MRRLAPFALLLPVLPCLLAGALRAQEVPAEEGAEEVPTPEVEKLAPGSLEVCVERAGKIERARQVPVRVLLEEYSGPLRLTQVSPLLRTGGPVQQGTKLLEIDLAPLARELRAAGEALASARLARQLLEREQKLEALELQQAVEQADLAAHEAARALQRFEQVEGPALLKDAELDLQGSVNQLDDAREELSQLEAMYKGTQLASETKEIVLERARRDVRLGEERLKVARSRSAAVAEYDHPLQLRTHQDQARWTQAALQQAKEKAAVEAEKRRDALESASHAVRDAEERVGRLETDRRAVEAAVAPASGLLAPAPDLRPGDLIDAHTAFTHVHEGALVARFPAAEEDLRLLAPGRAASVTLLAFGEVKLSGTVSEVAPLPAEADGSFAVTVKLAGEHALLREGLACRVEVPGAKLEGVLSVPRAAVRSEDGHTTVEVWKDGEAQAREVVLGAGNHERVAVLSGLAAGEEVVVSAEGGQ